jgi:glycosyltransferase involved in cell wall biosynthesis
MERRPREKLSPSTEPTTITIDICICTYNPRTDIFEVVVNSIINQTDLKNINVVIIDNASTPPLEDTSVEALRRAGIPARLVREPTPGLSNARLRAIKETVGEWILFIDDDNELNEAYISKGRHFILNNTDVGCFGGKLLLPSETIIPPWTIPFLPYLGIRDLGDSPLFSKSEAWTECEPPGAGAWVKRDVAALYARRLENKPVLQKLGRRKDTDLFSCDDSLIMRGAYALNLSNAYCPGLSLKHHLAPHRFEFAYLLKLMSGYGVSELLLEQTLLGEHPFECTYEDDAEFAKFLDHIFSDAQHSGRFRSAKMLWYIAAKAKHRADACNDMFPSLSIVTPCLNAVKTIGRTIESIIEQGYTNLQYIIVDGSSTDGTLEVIESYRKHIDILIVEKDKNVADALNKAFSRASGDLRAYLNADDSLTPGALTKVARIFSRDPEIDVVTGACHRWYVDGTDQLSFVPDNYLGSMALRNPIEQPSTFWRRSIQDLAGVFDDSFRLAFDWEYWNRLKTLGAKFHRTNKILSNYYFSSDNLTSLGKYSVVEEMYRITQKYAGSKIADLYMHIFETFDMNGYYDGDDTKIPLKQRRHFEAELEELTAQFGAEVIESYNWNWASKQIRGIKWY